MKTISKLLLAISFAISVTTSAFAVTVVVSWGGAYTESQKLGYGDPTAKKLGIEINWVDYSGGLSEIKAQKEAGAITWDIMDVYAKDTIIGCDEGLFVEFDFDKDFAPAPDGTPASEDFFTSMPSNHMAFVKSPDNISIEILQEGNLELKEPWLSMKNSGTW